MPARVIRLAHMARPLKILFLLEDLCYGGTQYQNLQLAARLDRNLFKPLILTLTGPTDLDGIAREKGLDIHHMGRDRDVPPNFFLRLGRELKKIDPDILLPCTALPNIWGRIWGAWQRIPAIVGSCRGGGALTRQHERLLWRLCTRMICNSQELLHGLLRLGVPPTRVSMIPNGVDVDFFMPGRLPMRERPLEIVCVARLAKDKDHITLFRAFEIILARLPNAILRLVGEGPEERNLRNWTNSHDLARHIIFSPAGADMRPYLSGARLFALASRREGMPNAVLEAMSAGLPVCATSVGGIPGLVGHGRTGLLSEPGNAMAMAENCLSILADSAKGERMGACGRRRVQADFSYTEMVARHERVFLDACAGSIFRPNL